MLQLIFRTIVGAIAGAVLCGFIFGVFLAKFELPAWVPDDPTSAAAVGAVIGGVVGAISGLRWLWRQQRMRNLASELSMSFSDKGDDDLTDHLKTLLAKQGFVCFRNVIHGDFGHFKVWMGDLSHMNTRSKNNRRTVRTVVLFESPNFSLPQFSMQVEGFFLNIVTGMIGMEDIDFDNYPEFSNAYHLSGTPKDAVRQLFQPPLLKYFGQRPGWEVRGEGNRLVVTQPKRLVSAGRLREFFENAREICTHFSQAADKQSEMPPPIREEPQASEPTGILANALKDHLVSSDEVASFLQAPPPRTIPPQISRTQVGGGSIVAIVMGAFFTVFGSGWLLMSFVVTAVNPAIPIFMGVMGTLILVAGISAIVLGLRFRRRKIDLLRNGRITNGVIESVEKTDVAINGQQRYLAHVNFSAAGIRVNETAALYGDQVRLAREAADQQNTVDVVYATDDPKRFLLGLQLSTRFQLRI